MKKIILICALSITSLGLFAQTDTTGRDTSSNMGNTPNKDYNNKSNKNTSSEYQNNENKNNDCAAKMVNGKMVTMENGKTTVMGKDTTMQNGTVVRMDGTVKMKDGKVIKMKEGDCMNQAGKVIAVKKTKLNEPSNTGTK